MAATRSEDAAQQWAQISVPAFPDLRHGALSFRRFGALLVAVDFARDRIRLQRIESLRPASGDFHRLLEQLQSLSQNFELGLHGNAYAYPTSQVPYPDQARLMDAYVRHGFRVRLDPPYELAYGPTPMASLRPVGHRRSV